MIGMSIEEKIKIQQHIIDNFQSEKENLLQQIQELEKSNKKLKDENTSALNSAKAMISTMEKEFDDFERLIKEFNLYKQKYKDLFVKLMDLKTNYEKALYEINCANKKAAENIGSIKKPTLLDKLRGKK